MKALFVILVMICLSATRIEAQKGFEGAGVIGLTTSQIDGDSLLGFNMLGLSAGIKVRFEMTRKLSGNVELLYSQRGSSSNLISRDDDQTITKLHYFELPVYLSFNDWYIESEGYYKMSGQLGLSYASLVSTSLQNTFYDDSGFSKGDLSYLIGATYHASKALGVTVRYTRAATKLYTDDALPPPGYLLSYFWTIRMEYYF